MGLQKIHTCNEVTIPAFEIEMLCCSIASWMLVRSASFICGQKKLTCDYRRSQLYEQLRLGFPFFADVQLSGKQEVENPEFPKKFRIFSFLFGNFPYLIMLPCFLILKLQAFRLKNFANFEK